MRLIGDQVRVMVGTTSRSTRAHRTSTRSIADDLPRPGHGSDYIRQERVEDVTSRAEEIRWSPAGGKHTSENIGERPFRMVEVELKNAGGPFQPTALDSPKLWPKFFRIPIEIGRF